MEDIEKVREELKKIGAKRVFVQFSEGLKSKIQEITKSLGNEFEFVLCCEPTYGACDVRDYEAKRIGCDSILHIGHSDMGLKSSLPIVYWEYFHDVNPLPILEKWITELKNFKRIGLVTSLQFVKVLEKVKKFLEKKGKKVFTEKVLKYPGQVLGCDVRAAEKIERKVDCFLYVGAGKFHPLGVALRVRKPVFYLDLEKKCIRSLENERDKWLKLKVWYDSKLKEAKRIGIIISWKKGQNRIKEARKLKRKLEKMGKEVSILAFDRVDPEKMYGLKFDHLINLACPRLEEDLILSKLCK